MAANEPEAAAGLFEGCEFKIPPGQGFTGSALRCSRCFACADTRSRSRTQATYMWIPSCKIVALVEIGDQSRLLRLPSERRLGSRARCRHVHRGESGDPAE